MKGENTGARPRCLARRGDQFVGGRRQHFGTASLPVLHAHGEAAAGADAGHRGRRDHDDERALQMRESRLRKSSAIASAVSPFLCAIFRVLEHREQRRGIACQGARSAGEACERRDTQ